MQSPKIDPHVARDRAVYAVNRRHHPDADHSAHLAALTVSTWLARVDRLIADAPPLSDEHRARVARQLAQILVGPA